MGRSLENRLFGRACAATDPSYPGFQAWRRGRNGQGLLLGFDLVGDLQYRMQSGYDPFPEQIDDSTWHLWRGELSNSHYSLRGFTPYPSAGRVTPAPATTATESIIDVGAGLRFSF